MQEFDIPFGQYFTHVYAKGDFMDDSKYIILLHGGPGGCAMLLKPLYDLADYGYTVIGFDQLGCGFSSNIFGHYELYKMKTFVDQITSIVKAFKIKKFHLLGHSWGGMVAMEYMTSVKDNKVDKLVLFSTLASTKTWNESNLKIALDLLDYKDEYYDFKFAYRRSDFNSDRVKKIFMERIWFPYYANPYNTSPHIREKLPLNEEMYEFMWGEFELFGTGTLKNWDVTKKIMDIQNETLIMYGSHDQSTKEVNKEIEVHIPHTKTIELTNSGHCGYFNEYPKVMKELVKFLG